MNSNQVPKGYKQTEVGVIPKDWEVRPLLKAVSLPTGQVDPRIEPYKFMVLIAPDHIESGTGCL
jgi:type I restriction enzyme, S subunit